MKRITERARVVRLSLSAAFMPRPPPSSILDALGANKGPRLRIFTVLGPRVHDEDTVRLEQLLLRTLRHRIREPELEARADALLGDRTQLHRVTVLPSSRKTTWRP